jgi:hypothetical protein
MTLPEEAAGVETGRRTICRAGFAINALGLTMGTLLFVIGQAALSTRIIELTVGLLTVLPIVNVAAVLLMELRRRDWGFVALALGVLAMLAYSVLDRLGSQ